MKRFLRIGTYHVKIAIETAVKASNNLLCASYNKDFSITSFNEFEDTITVAEFFQALPVLSNSLYWVFSQPLEKAVDGAEVHFVDLIRQSPIDMLLIAKKLCHRILFRDALVHVVGDWPRWIYDEDERVAYEDFIQIVEASHDKVQKEVAHTMHKMLASNEDKASDILQSCAELWRSGLRLLETQDITENCSKGGI